MFRRCAAPPTANAMGLEARFDVCKRQPHSCSEYSVAVAEVIEYATLDYVLN